MFKSLIWNEYFNQAINCGDYRTTNKVLLSLAMFQNSTDYQFIIV
jgi:hypothetical protein